MNFIKKNIYIFILVVIAIATHWAWFSPETILFSWDWQLWSDKAAQELWPFGQGAYSNLFDFGAKNIQIHFNAFFILWGLIGDFMLASKLTMMIPIAILSVLSPYFLINYFTKSRKIAFVSSLFFAFSVSLMYLQLSHLPIAFVFVLSPLVLLFFAKMLDDFSFKNLILFALVYSIGIWYEVRIMYIVSMILGVYLAIFSSWKEIWKLKKKYITLAFLIIFVNLFWILPTVMGDKSRIENMSNRGIRDTGANNIFYSLSNFKHKWSGEEVIQSSVMHDIPWIIWLAPILAFSVFFGFKKIKSDRDRKMIVFFSIVALLGILLAKQNDSPLEVLYDWLYYNVPGFGIFRVGSKFLLLVAFGYLGMIAFSLKYLIDSNDKLNRFIKNGVLVVIGLIFLWNAKPLLGGEVGNLFKAKEEPEEYQVLNNFISSQDEYFKTLWIPRESKWSHFSANKPLVSADKIRDDEFKNIYKSHPGMKSLTGFDFEPFTEEKGNYLADIAGIKYFIIPMKDEQDDVYEHEGKYKDYVEEIEKIDFLEEVEINGLDEIKVFENKGYESNIFASVEKEEADLIIDRELEMPGAIKTEIKNPVRKKVKIESAKKPFLLVMQDRFHPDWIVRTDSFIDEVREVDQKNHVEFYGFLNAWLIEPDKICQSNSICEKNPNGGYDMNLMIEFGSQKWYHLGLAISGISFVISLVFLVLRAIMKRKQ